MTTSQLYISASKFSKNPNNIDLRGKFLQCLASESNIERILPILKLDFEQITGPALIRLSEILPHDTELLVELAYWHYHFGLDDEAKDYLLKAKRINSNNIHVLEAEIYFSYGEPVDATLYLCNEALVYFPDNNWIKSVRDCILKHGQLTQLERSPKPSKWNQYYHSAGV